MPQYALPRHVFVCIQGEHVVFLDVRKDRYFALDAVRTAGLGEHVVGWPLESPPGNESLAAVMSVLVEKELLTSPGDGKVATPQPIEPVRGELCVDAFDERPGLRIGRVLVFVSAAVRARLLLKHRTFESVLARVKRRIESHRSHDMPEESRVQDLVSTFAFLRPYLFAAKDACLFDALALSEYLAA